MRIEFDSAEAAKAFRDKVRGSTVLYNVTVKLPPTVTELVDKVDY